MANEPTEQQKPLPDNAIRRLEQLKAAQPDLDDSTVIKGALRVYAAITRLDLKETPPDES